jgi:hypothetical protein
MKQEVLQVSENEFSYKGEQLFTFFINNMAVNSEGELMEGLGHSFTRLTGFYGSIIYTDGIKEHLITPRL